ncbi:MAG: hypothetical protein HKN47_27790 [Pirellulaceae bacterium]|nr:hypothetical protein [Pirellulaceae bacterium]
MTDSEHFRVRVYNNSRTTAYFELRDFPRADPTGCVGNTISLHQLLGDDYRGPSLNLDFDHGGRPIGIEVLYSMADDEQADEIELDDEEEFDDDELDEMDSDEEE